MRLGVVDENFFFARLLFCERCKVDDMSSEPREDKRQQSIKAANKNSENIGSRNLLKIRHNKLRNEASRKKKTVRQDDAFQLES